VTGRRTGRTANDPRIVGDAKRGLRQRRGGNDHPPTLADSPRAPQNAPPMTTVRKTKLVPPVWLALSIIAMALLHRFLPIVQLIHWPLRWLGVLPMIAGIALATRGASLFNRHGTGVVPFSPVTHLVLEGPYRFSRNPMYLGMVQLLIGVALLFGTLSPWFVIPLFAWWIDRRFIAQEEMMLEEHFGEDYLAFKRRVRRWI
jgi:protein-S-isoprenylcysteine O-methyltransferase Ste14